MEEELQNKSHLWGWGQFPKGLLEQYEIVPGSRQGFSSSDISLREGFALPDYERRQQPLLAEDARTDSWRAGGRESSSPYWFLAAVDKAACGVGFPLPVPG